MNPHLNSHLRDAAKLPGDAALDRKAGDVSGQTPPVPGKQPPETAPRGRSVQPWRVTGFVLSVIAILGAIAFIYPGQGVKIPAWRRGGTAITPPFTLYFPTWDDFFQEDTLKPKDLKVLLAALQGDDKGKAGRDTTQELRAAAGTGRAAHAIQYPGDDPSVLFPAFAAFEKARHGAKPARILHYGDSQIEGDRMSGLFRAKLQEQFGGSGPGLVAARPLASSQSVVQEASENMLRFTQYGVVDRSVRHRRYGAMAIFSRFSPPVPDSAYQETETSTGWISLRVSGNAYSVSKSFSTLKMYYGFNRSDVSVKVFVDDEPFADESLPANKGMRVKTWRFSRTPRKILIILEGYDSPDIYGLSMESNAGVVLDNISMRGSSGTAFGSLASVPFKPMLDSLNPKLLLLQFGGNTVPHIQDKAAAESYGRNFRSQIEYLKRLVPGAPVIVIGPGDMCTKVEGKMQTYPHLVHVRDALRQAAFDAGACFFDIYEAMGGQNSMIQWVEADPPLAAADYVHLAPQGAKVIAEAFIQSFMADYDAYRQPKAH